MEEKEIWFNYVIQNKLFWANGFTLKRLEKVKFFVLNDKVIMHDLLIRHNGGTLSPDEMKMNDIDNYNHCIENFICNILYKMIEKKIIKL